MKPHFYCIVASMVLATGATLPLNAQIAPPAPPTAVRAVVSQPVVIRPDAANSAYWPLASIETVAPLIGADALETPASGRVPNYLRLIGAINPDAVGPFAHLFRTTLYGGTVAPETKAAMGLEIARSCGSPYLAAHLTRVLHSTETGRRLLASGAGQTASSSDAREAIALRYAANLTRAVHGVSDQDFVQARGVYNDAQLVELTLTTCFFNYMARLCQGAGLPQEAWIAAAPDALPVPGEVSPYQARVTLASDQELKSAALLSAPNPEMKKGLGIGIANSQRAMVRVPDLADAWWNYGKVVRTGAELSRETQLQISFAVSMANGCRYCTLHQVAGLRRVGVEPAKLLAMQKDDAALTDKEKACVIFARKLTRTPQAMQASDLAVLKAALGSDRATSDALLQTCTFAFMNRFTDGLHLPSEDEAVKTYQEVYGEGAYARFGK